MQRRSSTDHLNESLEDLLPAIQENNPDGSGYAQLTLGDEDEPYFVHLSDKRKGKRPSSVKKVYLYVLLVLLVVAVVFISLYVIKLKSKCRRAEKSKSPICMTSGCVDAAYFIQNAIDPKANPCEDFFQYTCGRWMNKHPIPDKKNFWGIGSVLSQQNFWVMRKLLEKPVTEFKSKAEKEAIIYYKACMNDTVRERLGGKPLKDFLEKVFRGWKNDDFTLQKDFDITDYSKKLHASLSSAFPFLSVFVGPDDKNSSKNVIKIMQSGLGLQLEYYNKNLTDKPEEETHLWMDLMSCTVFWLGLIKTSHKSQKLMNLVVLTAYLDYMIEIRMLLEAKDRNQTKNQMLDVLLFEKNLSMIHVPSKNMTQVDQYYVKMTIKELMNKSSVIHWLKFFRHLYKNVTEITENDEVVTYSLPYLEKLPKLVKDMVKNSKEHILNNYIMWRVTEDLVPLLSDKFLDARKDLSIALYGAFDKTERWKYCIASTDASVGFALGAMFVSKVFPDSSRREANKMVENIRKAFINSLPSLQWMDDKTRKAAKEKALAVDQKIGYPPSILDPKKLDAMYQGLKFNETAFFSNKLKVFHYEMEKNRKMLSLPPDKNYWYMTPATINAYYDPSRNEIVFPAAILQQPYFDRDYPKVVNYGGMGAVIGHELLHGFDNNGRLYDKDGNYGKPWWTDHVVKGFTAKEKCFIKEYSNFTIQKKHVRGGVTLGENLADNGGLKAAYLAYQEWVRKHGEEPLLPGVGKNNKQVFFISYGQSWCAISRLARSLLMLKLDVHSPAKYRVLGTVRNMPEFAEAFNCPLGSYMNPVQKCSIW